MPTPIEVTCLECGAARAVGSLSNDALGLCPTCGYIGWALSRDVAFAELRTAAPHGFAFV